MQLNKTTEARFTDEYIKLIQNGGDGDRIVYLKYKDFQKLINVVNGMS